MTKELNYHTHSNTSIVNTAKAIMRKDIYEISVRMDWKAIMDCNYNSLEITGFLVEDIATAVIFTEPEEQESSFWRSC